MKYITHIAYRFLKYCISSFEILYIIMLISNNRYEHLHNRICNSTTTTTTTLLLVLMQLPLLNFSSTILLPLLKNKKNKKRSPLRSQCQPRLPSVAFGCLRLPSVAFGCLRLPSVAFGCLGLPSVAFDCLWSLGTYAASWRKKHGSLHFTSLHFASLRFASLQ